MPSRPSLHLSWRTADAAAGPGLARLVPAARREWAEAVWAEAHDVPTRS